MCALIYSEYNSVIFSYFSMRIFFFFLHMLCASFVQIFLLVSGKYRVKFYDSIRLIFANIAFKNCFQ